MDDILKYTVAYLIRFKTMDSDTYLKNYVFPYLVLTLDFDDDGHLAVEEDKNGEDVIVLFLEPDKIDQLIQFCEAEDIILEHRDVSDDILYDEVKVEVLRLMIQSEEFGAVFQTFLERNLTIDIILDKLSRLGEDSLTELDKKILVEQR